MVKVFVGNLAFKTTEADLAREFATAGKVAGANIITRGPRSLGYGFVEFDSLDDANNAVKLLNKKDIDGRPVNVEVAKPRAEGEEGAANNNAEGGDAAGRGRGGRRGGARGRGARGGARGTRGGARGGARSSSEGGQQGEEATSEEVEDTNRPRGGRRGRGGRGTTRGAPRGAPRGGRGGQRNAQGSDQPDNRVESKTTLFVANLPFSLDDETFGKVFTDDGLKFKSAHVVQKRNGRSKGFGFAEFDTEEDQKKALAALNNKKIQDRELIVKIALTDDGANKQAGEQQQQ